MPFFVYKKSFCTFYGRNDYLCERFEKEKKTVVFNNIKKFFETEFKILDVFICPKKPEIFIEYIDIKIEFFKKIDLFIYALGNIFITFIENDEEFEKEDEILKKSSLFEDKNILKLEFPIQRFYVRNVINNLNYKEINSFNFFSK
ncbi:hypothetical protein A0H76_217 [Hepatospora eriocheir]|uniref:Uncharacterized protein n=1 Tax=Hepatospora eriocheir TaxID=1081669 RepID=A0A1X0QJ94_9MICR|nr:hypothetical protein A0H76_217 [Hepatospora eriocheir]